MNILSDDRTTKSSALTFKHGINIMKKLSTLTKSAIFTLSMLGIGTLAIASGQMPTISSVETNDAVAIAKSKISLEQAIAIAQKTVKGDLVSAEFDQNDYREGGKFEIKTIAGDT